MTWVESLHQPVSFRWYQRFLGKILSSGEIPEHIAIIMDGNRRYARENNLPNVGLGHQKGAGKLKEVISWLSLVNGVKQLTVYAFSLLNFNRSEDEVKALMDLAEITFKDMADTRALFDQYQCKIRFIGRTDLLEERVRRQIKRVEDAGREDAPFTLNICVCYTAHDEMEYAREKCINQKADLTYDNVFSNLMLPSKPDILIRTSGVYRMSNFLLMQCSNTPIYVTNSLWPEISFWDVLKILVRYQLRGYVD